jgi:hypothetical protein
MNIPGPEVRQMNLRAVGRPNGAQSVHSMNHLSGNALQMSRNSRILDLEQRPTAHWFVE